MKITITTQRSLTKAETQLVFRKTETFIKEMEEISNQINVEIDLSKGGVKK